MTSKRIFLTTLLAVITIAFTACKKDDAQPAFEYRTQGFVKGKLTGSTSDNTYTFNDNFNYTQYGALSGGSTYTAGQSGSYLIAINRSDFNAGGSVTLNFILTSAKDTTPDGIGIDFSYSKELSDKFVDFHMQSEGNNTATITEFTFDSTTGRAKGKYSLMGSDNTTEKEASVTGDFDVIAKRVVQ